VDHPGEARRPLWRRWVPHWPIVVVFAIVAALALWFASYGTAS
jgi:hypothetical protein